MIFQEDIIQKDIDWFIKNCLYGNSDIFYGFIVPTIKFRSEQNTDVKVSKLMTYVSFGD